MGSEKDCGGLQERVDDLCIRLRAFGKAISGAGTIDADALAKVGRILRGETVEAAPGSLDWLEDYSSGHPPPMLGHDKPIRLIDTCPACGTEHVPIDGATMTATCTSCGAKFEAVHGKLMDAAPDAHTVKELDDKRQYVRGLEDALKTVEDSSCRFCAMDWPLSRMMEGLCYHQVPDSVETHRYLTLPNCDVGNELRESLEKQIREARQW